MRRRTIAIIGAVVLALVAAGLVVWYVSSLKEEKTPVVVTGPVVVAVADIPARTTGEEMVANGLVQEQQVGANGHRAGAVTSLSSLQGMVLSVPVVSGQQLLQTQLADAGRRPCPSGSRPECGRSPLASIDKNSVGGAIKEGDRVDVIATFKSDEFQVAAVSLGAVLSPTEVARIQALTGLDLTKVISGLSVTILQQAEVLAVDPLEPSSTAVTQAGSRRRLQQRLEHHQDLCP